MYSITDSYDTTAMEFAAGCDTEKGLEILIKAGVSVNITKSEYKQGPLMQAAIGSNTGIHLSITLVYYYFPVFLLFTTVLWCK